MQHANYIQLSGAVTSHLMYCRNNFVCVCVCVLLNSQYSKVRAVFRFKQHVKEFMDMSTIRHELSV